MLRTLITSFVVGVALVVGCGVQALDLSGKTCPCDTAAGWACDPQTNKCVSSACSGKSCADLGVACGPTDDGCGRFLQCEECASKQETCIANKCVCTANTCQSQHAQCGSIPDGCGGDNHDCGGCPSGQSCGGGGDHVCGANACVPKTACVAGDCGGVSDNCGGVLTCAPCCAAKNCTQLGAQCGELPDGCGGTAKCGSCSATTICTAAHKCCATCASLGATCGELPDGCGETLHCGTCDGGTCGPISHHCE